QVERDVKKGDRVAGAAGSGGGEGTAGSKRGQCEPAADGGTAEGAGAGVFQPGSGAIRPQLWAGAFLAGVWAPAAANRAAGGRGGPGFRGRISLGTPGGAGAESHRSR